VLSLELAQQQMRVLMAVLDLLDFLQVYLLLEAQVILVEVQYRLMRHLMEVMVQEEHSSSFARVHCLDLERSRPMALLEEQTVLISAVAQEVGLLLSFHVLILARFHRRQMEVEMAVQVRRVNYFSKYFFSTKFLDTKS
jgi:hypothetical protein